MIQKKNQLDLGIWYLRHPLAAKGQLQTWQQNGCQWCTLHPIAPSINRVLPWPDFHKSCKFCTNQWRYNLHIGNHHLQSFFGYQRAEIWPTWPNIKSFMRIHLTMLIPVYTPDIKWVDLSAFQIMAWNHLQHFFGNQRARKTDMECLLSCHKTLNVNTDGWFWSSALAQLLSHGILITRTLNIF